VVEPLSSGSPSIRPRIHQEDVMQTIGWAVKELQNGCRVRRSGWNGKGMWIGLMHPDEGKMTVPYVYMFTAQGDLVPWLCSQTDLLATDWEIPND
jgi:hypothetical protein